MGLKNYSPLRPSVKPRITIERVTPKMLEVLDFMQDFDVLPSTYVMSRFGHWHGTRQILVLFNQAHFIRVPKGYQHFNARSRPFPYELTDLGRRALEQCGRLRRRERMNDHFNHAYMRSVIQHSFAVAPDEIPGITLHTEADILSHPHCPPETKAETNPSWFEALGHVVRPDAPLFGYEYKAGGKSAFMFFHGFEADRATERQTTTRGDFQKKTLAKMFAAYADYIERGVYEDKYGLPRIAIPVIAIGEGRMRAMLETLKATVPDEKVRRRFIFKWLPDFLMYEPLPKPTAHMVTEPWTRTDGEFSILETLKATANRK